MRRIPELDSVRGLAAVGIVLFHYTHPGPLYERVFFAGWVSLEIFFVLSGYLITTIILEHGGRPGFFRKFYARRSLRIWPVYYLFLLAVVLVQRFKPGIGSVEALPQYLTFTQNLELYWSQQEHPFLYVFSPTWSLAIEEQFYLLWPLLVLLIGARKRPARLAWLTAAAVGLAIALRLRGFNERLLLARSDGFALGGLLAALPVWGEGPGVRAARWGFLGALVGGVLYLTAGHVAQGQPVLEQAGPFSTTAAALAAFGCVGLILGPTGAPVLAPLRERALRYVGTISYGVYLYHLACLVAADVVVRALNLPRWTLALAALPLCAAVAVGSWELVESPILRLKDRFRYGPNPDPDPATKGEKVDAPAVVGGVEAAVPAPAASTD